MSKNTKKNVKIQKITQKIVLGSSSIYRQELLRRLQIPFDTASPQVDESTLPKESPEKTARRLAEAKARFVAKTHSQALIIGSDQVAVLDGIRLGKPMIHANAVRQLQLVRGREVTFFTALCLLNSFTDQLQVQVVPYHVRFRPLNDQQIESYLRKEQPYHCAGSAKSEGLGIALIERMTGDDPNALIGLPLISLIEMLENEGISVI